MADKFWHDKGIVDAIIHWITLGLPPGGCTECIIQDDYEGAEARAHHNLKNDSAFTFQELYTNMQSIIPPSLIGKIEEHQGLKHTSTENLELMQFEFGMMGHDDFAQKVTAILGERKYQKLIENV